MGIFDYVAGMQVKATPDPEMHDYKIGEKVPLQDGAYVCYEGIFIVKEGRVLAASETVFNKWGGQLEPFELLHQTSPVSVSIKQYEKQKE